MTKEMFRTKPTPPNVHWHFFLTTLSKVSTHQNWHFKKKPNKIWGLLYLEQNGNKDRPSQIYTDGWYCLSEQCFACFNMCTCCFCLFILIGHLGFKSWEKQPNSKNLFCQKSIFYWLVLNIEKQILFYFTLQEVNQSLKLSLNLEKRKFVSKIVLNSLAYYLIPIWIGNHTLLSSQKKLSQTVGLFYKIIDIMHH